MSTYLIVADRQAWSLGLARSLETAGTRDRNMEFVIVVPADPSFDIDESQARLVAQEAAARARTSLQLKGFTVLEAMAGASLPRKALEDEMSRGSRSYDGIVVGMTRRNPTTQIQADLVKQLERRHGIPVQVIHLNGTMIA